MPDIALQLNNHIITNGNMAGSLASSTIDISNAMGYCVYAVWSGAPVGNIIIQASLDGVVFKDVSTTAAGGAAGSVFSNNDGIHYPFVKVIYTFTSGTGTLNVNLSAKKYV